MTLTEEQIRRYREEGYLVLPRFFDAAETAAMQSELRRLVREDKGRNVLPGYAGLVNYLIEPLDGKSPLFRALFFCEKAVQAAECLLGGPPVLWKDQLYLKPARVGSGNPWHADCLPKGAEALKKGKNLPLAGPGSSGGEKEYGVRVAGAWRREVEKLVRPA